MHRIAILAVLAQIPLLALGQTIGSDSVPVIHFSLYAPPQKDPPVHILGFEHDQKQIRFLVSNTSDKSVVKIIVGLVEIVPPGCSRAPSSETYRSVRDWTEGAFKVSAGPRGIGLASPRPEGTYWPAVIVDRAEGRRLAICRFSLGSPVCSLTTGLRGLLRPRLSCAMIMAPSSNRPRPKPPLSPDWTIGIPLTHRWLKQMPGDALTR
jgi:hypothetical protein